MESRLFKFQIEHAEGPYIPNDLRAFSVLIINQNSPREFLFLISQLD